MSYGENMWQYKSDHPDNGQPHPTWFKSTFRENNKQPRSQFRKSLGQETYKHSPKKIVCCYCEGEHLIKDCATWLRRSPRTCRETQRWPCGTKTNSEMLCIGVTSQSLRHHLPGHQRQLTPCAAETEQIIGNLQLDESD